jgi:general secretion pathway protein G
VVIDVFQLTEHRRARSAGFTLIELLVVLAIVALLLSVALPRYFASVETAKEAALKQNLQAVRHAIDRYRGDTGKYPATLDVLVQERYLRQLPEDPFTESVKTWKLVASPNASESGLYDIRSGAQTVSRDGSQVSSW